MVPCSVSVFLVRQSKTQVGFRQKNDPAHFCETLRPLDLFRT